MGLTKVNYVNNQTVISAESMNAIQDAIIALEESIGEGAVGIASIEQTTVSDEDGGTNVITINLTDGTSHSFQMKNGSKGSSPVRGTDYWTDEDKAEILAGIKVLTDDEINVLDYLLMNDTPVCAPAVTATYHRTSSTNPNFVTTYYCRVYIDITNIASSLVQKVEVATLNPDQSLTSPSLTWKEATVTLGEINHTAAYSTSSSYVGTWNYGMGVKFTYYDVFGKTCELYRMAVSS